MKSGKAHTTIQLEQGNGHSCPLMPVDLVCWLEANKRGGEPKMEVVLKTQNARPITLTLSDNHLEMMVKNHLLKDHEADDITRVAQVAQQVFDRALGLPEDCWQAWDDWAKGLE